MNRNSLLLALCCLLAGFAAAWWLYADKNATENTVSNSGKSLPSAIENPFVPIDDDQRLNALEADVEQIKQQLTQIEQALDDFSETLAGNKQQTDGQSTADSQNINTSQRMPSLLNRRLYNLDNLIRGGIDPVVAEDIVRRKNSVELKRLQLQDRARRENYLNTPRYYDELEAINRQEVNLRDELGDDVYDRYLFDSRQNNRVRVSTVMLGSAAEEAGIKAGDVILSYDDRRVFNWQELKQATAQGQLGDYVNLTVYRDGTILSFTVPRGPLGVQLGAARLQP